MNSATPMTLKMLWAIDIDSIECSVLKRKRVDTKKKMCYRRGKNHRMHFMDAAILGTRWNFKRLVERDMLRTYRPRSCHPPEILPSASDRTLGRKKSSEREYNRVCVNKQKAERERDKKR